MTAAAQRKPVSGLSRWWKKYGSGCLFVAPFVILYTVFIILPVIMSFIMSFSFYNLIQPAKFIGFTNYQTLFMEDDVFLISLKNTFVFVFITGPIGLLLSFLMAWLINNMKGKNAFALGFYAPSITSASTMSVIWLYIFSSDRYGLINNILFNLGIIDQPILWVTNPDTIMLVIIVISLWMSMGTGFLVFLAGFQNISAELYEAASVDGISNRFQQLFYITIPQMKPQILFGVINTMVSAFSVFDVSMSVCGLPSPNYAGHTIVAHLYDYAFIRYQMGYASAIATVLFLITFFFGRISMRLLSSRAET